MSSWHDWQQGLVNRNFHVFKQLLKHPKVSQILLVDFLPHNLKRFLRSYQKNLFSKNKDKQHQWQTVYQDLSTKCIANANKKLFVFSTTDSFCRSKQVIKKIKKVYTLFNDHTLPLIIWSYSPLFIDYFNQWKNSFTIFDAVNNWMEQPSFKNYRKRLQNNYQKISRQSDLVFTLSPNLSDLFKRLGRSTNTYYIPSGVDLAHYQLSKQQENELIALPRPIIGYIGTIQKRIDTDLLEYLAKKNPNKSFVFVGPVWPHFLRGVRRSASSLKQLENFSNIYFLGQKSYQQLPNYLSQFDVAIIPHRLDEFTKYTAPLKLLEYLAAGKPVVSTPIGEIKKIFPSLYFAENYSEFNQQIQLALTEDNEQLRKQRIDLVKEYSWEKTINRMLKLINQQFIKTKD